MSRISVRAPHASAVWLCLFDGTAETRIAMARRGENWFAPRPAPGTRYGFRADGRWAPDEGHWFDPAKLLVDPRATELDGRFVYHASLSAYGVDTATLVPKAIARAPRRRVRKLPPCFTPGGLIYEAHVRGLTMLHPHVPEGQRGTVAALAHPAIIAHLKRLNVSAIELMPLVAWIDERHLPPLGLSNYWGYNPVALVALDPGLCPGGVAELRATVAALHRAGIGVILDLVFNHTGESDVHGPILSLRGLDNAAYAHAPDGTLINDTGCGNTLDFANPDVRALVLEAMRHFVGQCGVDGFRFDLATILARGPGFDADAPLFAEIAADPLLADRVLIAEPWDIGPGGYQLGRFPGNWLEWNDRFRDDVRRYWRGDGTAGALATRLAGSSDVFGKACRSVNFLAAHDGFTLADTVRYATRHNQANGEENRDGHGENFSWNHGVEGESNDPAIGDARRASQRAMLATLFASTGTIMLSAGDEFGRTQHGNNNAYAQDNATSWLDWSARDMALEDFVAALSAQRAAHLECFTHFPEPGQWQRLDGEAMHVADWESIGGDGFAYHAAGYSLTVDRTAHLVSANCDSPLQSGASID